MPSPQPDVRVGIPAPAEGLLALVGLGSAPLSRAGLGRVTGSGRDIWQVLGEQLAPPETQNFSTSGSFYPLKTEDPGDG